MGELGQPGAAMIVRNHKAVATEVLVERNEQIVEMVAAGMTLEFVGRAYGITRERVRQIFRRARPDFKIKGRFHKEEALRSTCPAYSLRWRRKMAFWSERNAAISYLVALGEHPRKIAEFFGISVPRVYQIMKQDRDRKEMIGRG